MNTLITRLSSKQDGTNTENIIIEPFWKKIDGTLIKVYVY